MAKGMLEGLSEIRPFGLPIGAVGGGLVIQGAADALGAVVNGFSNNKIPSWAVKGVMAFALVKWGHKVVGNDMAQVGALLVTADAVQDLVNIRGSVNNIVNGLTGRVVHNSPPTLTGPAGVTKPAFGVAFNMPKVPGTAADYYAMAEGRR